MTELVVAHTGQLGGAALGEARDLLYAAFDDMTEGDWEHCLGGMHALLRVDGELVGHAALVQRVLGHGGRMLRCGYVEGVVVRADVRRQGHGSALMSALEELARGAYEVAALGATDDGAALYATRGWLPWPGPTFALTPTGPVRTPDADGAVWVLPLSADLDLPGGLTCDWREGDPW